MIVLDCETTGIDAMKSSIASIGAVDFGDPTNTFYQECRVPSTAVILEIALEMNGFTREELQDPGKLYPIFAVQKLIEWAKPIEERVVGGLHPSFDIAFCEAALGVERGRSPLGYRSVDLYTLVYTDHIARGCDVPLKEDGMPNIDTDMIFQYVGLPPEPKPHHALTGAKMEAEAFSRLLYGKQLLDELKQHAIPEYLHRE